MAAPRSADPPQAPPESASAAGAPPPRLPKLTPRLLGRVAEFLDDDDLRNLANSRKRQVRDRLLALRALPPRFARIAAAWDDPGLLRAAVERLAPPARAELWHDLSGVWERACQRGKTKLMDVFLSTELFLGCVAPINAMATGVAVPRALRVRDPAMTHFLLRRNWIPDAAAPDAKLLCVRAGYAVALTTRGSRGDADGLTAGETALLLSKGGGGGGTYADAAYGASFGPTVEGEFARAKDAKEYDSSPLGAAGYVPPGVRERELVEAALRAQLADAAEIGAFDPDGPFR